jgi:hypothetical protein
MTADLDDAGMSPSPVLSHIPTREPLRELTPEEIFGSKEKARAFEYRERNRERLRALKAAYRAKHADEIRLKQQARRAIKKAAQLTAQEQRREELKASLRDPSAIVLLRVK